MCAGIPAALSQRGHFCSQREVYRRCEGDRTETVVIHVGIGGGGSSDDAILNVGPFTNCAAGANADGCFYADILHQLCSIAE